MESTLKILELWAALVWADGKISKREATAMRRLIAGAGLNDGERRVALSYLDEPVEMKMSDLADLSAPAREGLYRAALKLSAVDDELADEEIDFLGRMRRGLDLDDAAAERIEDAVAAGE